MSKLTQSQIAKASTDAQIDFCLDVQPTYEVALARRIEAAATEPLLKRIAHLEATASANYGRGHADAHSMLTDRIAELEANEKVLLSQVQGHTKWREKIVKASEQAYGESAIRYKFSLTKTGKCMNTFPKEIDGRWFALVPAEDDGHIGHIARIAELERRIEAGKNIVRNNMHRIGQLQARVTELERQLEEERKDAERYRWLRNTSNPDNPLHMIALHINDAQQDTSLSGIDKAIDAAMNEQK